MNFRTFLLVICFFKYGQSVCKKQIVVLPLFTGNNDCSESGVDLAGKECGEMITEFVRRCTHQVNDNRRDILELLLANYTDFTPCDLGPKGSCENVKISKNDVILTSNYDASLFEKINRRFLPDSNSVCQAESMGIIVTDIPCRDINNYPDVKKMFDEQLENTIKIWNTQYFLHTVIYWITPHDKRSDLDFGPCSKLRNRYFQKQVDFLQLDVTDYKSFLGQGSICDHVFPSIHKPPDSSGRNLALTLGLSIGCSIIAILMLALCIFCAFRIRRRQVESRLKFFADQHTREHRIRTKNLFFRESRPVDEWEITPKDLKVEVQTVLGTGISAIVYKGHLKKKMNDNTIEMDVAVKFAHSYADSSARKDMIREIDFMKTLGQHVNLLFMVGCVTDPDNPVIATEFCANGDLLKILRKHELHFLTPNKCAEVEICLLLADLLKIACQVCAGMKYLTSLKYVHRDLAARNVMIMHNMTARVGDFGLCRLANESLYIQRGGKLPIKHMPFEALKYGEFSEKSDVWAYGVLLYEMFKSGKRPFEGIETDELIKHLEVNGKPEFPDNVPDQVVRLVNTKCFDKEPKNRGTFAEIEEEMKKILEMFSV